MQSQSDNMKEQVWTKEELKNLIEYTQHLRMENEELQAKLIAMDAKLRNEEAKTKKLIMTINYLTNPQ
jgi:regulator of replication initiation timing